MSAVQGITSKQMSLTTYLKERAAYYKKSYLKVFFAELLKILEDVAETGPADTGASSGEAGRGTGHIPKWHPAYGKTIGHAVGQSGWQIIETKDGYSLINPMWDHYLMYIELGVVHGAGQYAHFVQAAWNRHIRSRATFRKKALADG